MLLLALDTCDARGSVALLGDHELRQVAVHDSSDDYSVWLLPAIQRILAAAAVTFPEIDVYVAAAGPGSFTGVRVGLTTVKAWAEVTGKPIVSVSRLEALASNAAANHAYVAAFTNAQRHQVYGALYRRRGSDLERVGEEAVIAPERFVAWVGDMASGDSVEWISTDCEMLTETEAWEARQSGSRGVGEPVQSASPVLAPTIGRLGHRFARQERFTDPLALDANYVRRADAEVVWTDRHAQQQSK